MTESTGESSAYVVCREHGLIVGSDGVCPGDGVPHTAWIRLEGGTLDVGLVRRRTWRDRLARPLWWLSRAAGRLARLVGGPSSLAAFVEEFERPGPSSEGAGDWTAG